MKALEIRENMIHSKDEYSEEEYADSLQHINENIEEIKQHLLDGEHPKVCVNLQTDVR